MQLSGCSFEAFPNTHAEGQHSREGCEDRGVRGARSTGAAGRAGAPSSGRAGTGKKADQGPFGTAAPGTARRQRLHTGPRGALRAGGLRPRPGTQAAAVRATPGPAELRSPRRPRRPRARPSGAGLGGAGVGPSPAAGAGAGAARRCAGRSRCRHRRAPLPCRCRPALSRMVAGAPGAVRVPRSRRGASGAGLGRGAPRGLRQSRERRAARPAAPWVTAGTHGPGKGIRAAPPRARSSRL